MRIVKLLIGICKSAKNMTQARVPVQRLAIKPKETSAFADVVIKPLEKPVKPIMTQSVCLSATDKLNKMAKDNPVLQCLIDMYRQDHVADSEILKVINATLNHQKTGDRFYRFVGKDELSKVLSGATVTSNRPCHNGRITDVTSNPNYGGVPTLGKYRILFKDLAEFNPIEPGKSRIIEKELSKKEFQLIGGYSIGDIEKIEQNTGSGYMQVWP